MMRGVSTDAPYIALSHRIPTPLVRGF